MEKHQLTPLTLKKKTIVIFSGNGEGKHTDSTERTTITFTMTSLHTILSNRK
ncbi:hypothetical protein K3G39_20235 [Pontibacter sp. HSC-14F20]|uniref:hypothetical protein n=1 Tax=Pontibacter sp. HSC-14F20 TaxID=2864136 RepID=UPI001C732A84|nr:hypothetical protein [Pontibacter sp. HSC-14F20]MBX0335567.1 hypothetical protein [Pontibacter sp. HSC-14F20]